eukprot:9411245-Alexandrium_andersonii.AAC.1
MPCHRWSPLKAFRQGPTSPPRFSGRPRGATEGHQTPWPLDLRWILYARLELPSQAQRPLWSGLNNATIQSN